MPIWIGIALGGALGALARYALNTLVQSRLAQGSWAAFPLGTLLINVVGSFLLGLTIALNARGLISPELRLAFGTGFVGAFTTFSTFEWESDLLLRSGEGVRSALYIFGNLLMGYAAVLFGRWIAGRIGGLG
ncbi:CrcB protein [Deinococcus metalli]|uniref:Fluoride-specific ion channel FluC n=1 Tax=Deinococcus metalli TaxID=1141878 RepID=A0A7W8KIS9_9DEIO|nr:fluoride efflux transporter CrcB [Deinococcus metalli]MBB5378971.1 CrcB protein [Deinococcus metalli]GHF63667.1 putative fluoride ion transporter CrcB [Deinococcus metalli]